METIDIIDLKLKRNYLLTTGLKSPLLGLIQFLVPESLLKIVKNTFYFTLKAIFIIKIFKCLS